MEKKYIVSTDSDLVSFLRENGIAKNKIKTYVKLGFIYVNDKEINALVFLGDINY